MSSDPPQLDGRDAAAIRADLGRLVPNYTTGWDPERDNAGRALLTLFAEMAGHVTDRLDQVPAKQRIAFFDSLGFRQQAPLASRVPITFAISPDIDRNVQIPAGTQTAAPATEETPEQRFELPPGAGFEGTPAQLTHVYSVDPAKDELNDHAAPLAVGDETTLFAATDVQRHALCIGHPDLLTLESGTSLWVTLESTPTTNLDALSDNLVWEFYGTVEEGSESIEGWHAFAKVNDHSPSDKSTLVYKLELPGPDQEDETGAESSETTETVVGNIESHWIRCRLILDSGEDEETLAATREELFKTRLAAVWLSLTDPQPANTNTGGEFEPDKFAPSKLLSGDVPIPLPTSTEADADIAPFGEGWPPRPTFYLASKPAFSKKGQSVEIQFERSPDRKEPDTDPAEFDISVTTSPSDGKTIFVDKVAISGNDKYVVAAEDNETFIGKSGVLTKGTYTDVEVVFKEDYIAETGTKTVTLGLYEATESGDRRGDEPVSGTTSPEMDITFSGLNPPRLSWEYWNGDGWTRFESVEDSTNLLRTSGTVRVTVPEDIEPARAAGFEDYWIRVRLVSGEYVQLRYDETKETPTLVGVPPTFSDISLSFSAPEKGDGTEGMASIATPPAHLVSDNSRTYSGDLAPVLAAAVEPSITPFAGLPDESQTLYLGFDRPLDGGPIQLLASLTDVAYDVTFYPRVRWEVLVDAKSDTWERIPVTDETAGLTQRGIVGLSFEEPTTSNHRFGADRHWVRARVSGKQFDAGLSPTLDIGDTEPVSIHAVNPERERVVLVSTGASDVDIERYSLRFDCLDPPVTVGPFRSKSVVPAHGALEVFIRPFTAVLGNMLPLEVGDLWERGIRNRSRGRYVTALGDRELHVPAPEIEVTVADELRRLAESKDRDTVVLSGALVKAATVTEATPASGKMAASTTLHYYPSASPFDPCVDTVVSLLDPAGTVVDRWSELEPSPRERWLETVPPAGLPGFDPPVLTGLYPNTGWAVNVQTITGEILGSSDGAPGLTFDVSTPPVIDATVWVDELDTLGPGERAALVESSTTVRPEESPSEERLQAFWVEWTAVESFGESSSTDRHYRLDPVRGTVTFGDGQRGRIPPRVDDGISIDYRTGGGTTGNVPVETVTNLVSSIQYVDGVTNPTPADGGAEAEPVSEVVARAPMELRDRNRAVTAADFERLATSASRRLARVRCLPGMDRAGEYRLGWVSVLVVPDASTTKPTPSVTLKQQVSEALEAAAPATLVEESATDGPSLARPELVVRGPSWIAVDVEAVVVPEPVDSFGALESRLYAALEAFLHPLTGGPEGAGWRFGQLPCRSDLFALFEMVEGVDYVPEVALTLVGADESLTVTDDDATPDVAPDTLIYSGNHALELSVEEPPQIAEES